MKLFAAIPVIAVVCLVGAASAQKVTRPPKAPAATHPVVPAQEPKKQPDGPTASPQYLDKLLKLSPEQRNKALSSLPPQRRAQILAKLDNYQKVPPQQRARELDLLQRLQMLPPPKRAQVRNALRQFQAVPQPRRQQIQKQAKQLAGLPDGDRRSLMNSEEFRSKYTPAEQQMIEDLSLVEAKR
jgi:phage-related protein